MLRKIRKQLKQFHMLEQGDKILIGLSGGADSICLAEIFCRLREEYALELGAVYCHHGIRGEEADEDGLFVKMFCEERKITYYEVYEKVEERAREKKLTVEEAGREFRYETFEKIMETEGFDKIAVAHHANDRGETMLFHLARGTGLAGLCTMEPVKEFSKGKMLIRPLLWTARQELIGWLEEEGISWREDSTNLSDVYTRNRIRHNILPELQKVNTKAVEHMGDTADAVREAVDFLKLEEDKVWNRCVMFDEFGKKIRISISRLDECHIYIKKAVLHRAMGELVGSRKDIGSVHVKMLLDLMAGESGKEVSLTSGICGRKEYDTLILSVDEWEEQQKKETVFDHIQVKMEKMPYNGQEISKNKYTKYFDCDKIIDNLVLRHWKEGDYLYLREDGGKKKLGRYFIDEKIPKEERRRIPLLADGDHILWVVGHRISAYYKVTDETKNILIVNIENKG